MATPFRIKRSAVPGKAPAVSDLQLGELALNTYDAELYTLRSRPGIGTEVVKIGGAAVTNVLYVNKDGSDENTGFTAADAKQQSEEQSELDQQELLLKLLLELM